METTEDVKPETEASSATEDVKPKPDASSVPAEQTSTTDDGAPKSIRDVIQQTVDAAGEAESSAAEGQAKKSDSTIESDKGKAAATEDAEARKPVPYERFTEVNEKFRSAEARLKEVEPLATAQTGIATFCTEHGISPAEFNEGMEMLRLFKTDPEVFHKKVSAMATEVAPLVGETLPADIQKDVDDGNITLEFAKRLVKAEAKARLSGEATKRVEQKSAVQKAADAQNAVARATQTTISAWVNNKKATDPDFVPKTNGGPDGKYEAFMAQVALLCQTEKLATPDDAAALLEKAYVTTTSLFSRFTPRARPSRLPSSQRSSIIAEEGPKNIKDVVFSIARKHGFPG